MTAQTSTGGPPRRPVPAREDRCATARGRRRAGAAALGAALLLLTVGPRSSAGRAVRGGPAVDTLGVEESYESLHLDSAGAVDRLRRAVGDTRLRPWRLTPVRFETYLAGIRAGIRTLPAAEAWAAQRALDPDRHPELTPWAAREPLRAGEPDAAQRLAGAIRAQPPLAAALQRHVPVDDWAASHVKLIACARALSMFTGFDGELRDGRYVRAWLVTQRPRVGPEMDFAESLLVLADGVARLDAAYTDAPPAPGAASAHPVGPAKP